jgi:hypothetical protein
VSQLSHQAWIRVVFALVGLFGVAFAISGVLLVLPPPAVGGTCGPGTASEAPIVALLNPVSIGAGAQPPTKDTADHRAWAEFVSECQSSADNRGLASLAILVVSVAVGIGGPMVVLRRKRRPTPSSQPSQSALPAQSSLPAQPALPPAPLGGDWRV